MNLLKKYFQRCSRLAKCESGVVSIEIALIWATVGMATITAGWHFYGSYIDRIEETSNHDQRRGGMHGLTRTGAREIIGNPVASSTTSLTIDEFQDLTNADDTKDPNKPWEWATTHRTFTSVDTQGLVDGVDEVEVPKLNAVSRLYRDEFKKCNSTTPQSDADVLSHYVGHKYDRAESARCGFTRMVIFYNQSGRPVPVFTPHLSGDVPRDPQTSIFANEFFASYFSDQMETWESAEKDNCESIATLAAKNVLKNTVDPFIKSKVLNGCIEKARDPVRNRGCYLITGYDERELFNPSTCGAAPVVNIKGDIVAWRRTFKTKPMPWRENEPLYKLGQRVYSNNRTHYISKDADFNKVKIPELYSSEGIISVVDKETGKVSRPGTPWKLSNAQSTSGLLYIDPGSECSNNLKYDSDSAFGYSWLKECNPLRTRNSGHLEVSIEVTLSSTGG